MYYIKYQLWPALLEATICQTSSLWTLNLFLQIFGPSFEKFSHDKQKRMIVQQDGATHPTCNQKIQWPLCVILVFVRNE